ncbi:MAG: tetratricopeptide repeat protein [Candidatus Bathyarchaeia archaeon]
MGSDSVEGQGEESIFSMVDELTTGIKKKLELSEAEIANDIDRTVGEIVTSSPEALKYFMRATEFSRIGDFSQCIEPLKRAISIDPKFARAYIFLGSAYSNMGNSAEMNEYYQKAFEHKVRLSEIQRLRLEILVFSKSEKTYGNAFKAYDQLLELYPDEWRVNAIGMIYKNLENWDNSVELFNRWIQHKDYDSYMSNVNLAETYMAKGLYDKAKEILDVNKSNFSENAWVRIVLAINYLSQGDYKMSLAEADKAFLLDPSLYYLFWIKGDVYHCMNDLTKAEQQYLRLMETNIPASQFYARDGIGALYLYRGMASESMSQIELGIEKAEEMNDEIWEPWFLSCLVYTQLALGNPEEALRLSDKLLSIEVGGQRLDFKRRALFFKGLTYIMMESLELAQKLADEYRMIIQDQMNQKEMRFYHFLIGKIELQKENYSNAIECFERALSLLHFEFYRFPTLVANDHALFIESLAFAHYKNGELDKAIEEYGRIATLTLGRIHYGDIYVKSFYMLGKIYEEQGDNAKAIAHYEIFLDLWKDADPGIAEVEDARERLANLRVNNP